MNEQQLHDNIRTLYRKMFYLQAEISALKGVVGTLLQAHSDNDIAAIQHQISEKTKMEYDRLISEIEDESPSLAAYLDFREVLDTQEQDRWYFPREDTKGGQPPQ